MIGIATPFVTDFRYSIVSASFICLPSAHVIGLEEVIIVAQHSENGKHSWVLGQSYKLEIAWRDEKYGQRRLNIQELLSFP
ncbi:hypothetical protein ACSBR2_025216 [Camellia fascicularis]